MFYYYFLWNVFEQNLKKIGPATEFYNDDICLNFVSNLVNCINLFNAIESCKTN